MKRLKGRSVRRLAVAALAGALLFAVYWFTRPPELVWWKSPLAENYDSQLRVLIPYGWTAREPGRAGLSGMRIEGVYAFGPSDTRPWYLRWLPAPHENSDVLSVLLLPETKENLRAGPQGVQFQPHSPGRGAVMVTRYFHSRRVVASVYYERSNAHVFNRTYKQICDSLTIE